MKRKLSAYLLQYQKKKAYQKTLLREKGYDPIEEPCPNCGGQMFERHKDFYAFGQEDDPIDQCEQRCVDCGWYERSYDG